MNEWMREIWLLFPWVSSKIRETIMNSTDLLHDRQSMVFESEKPGHESWFCKNCNCSRVGFQDIDLGSKERNFGELRIKIFLTEWCKQKCLLHGRTQSSNIRLTIIWQLRGKGTLRWVRRTKRVLGLKSLSPKSQIFFSLLSAELAPSFSYTCLKQSSSNFF